MEFIDGTCVKQVTSDVLSQQWERCNAIVEESHRGLHPGSSSSSKVQPAAFIAKTNNNTNNFNRRVNGNNNNNNANRGPNPNLLCKNCGIIGHTIGRCYEIIGYPTGFKRNPNLSRHTHNNNNKINANTEVNHFVPRTSGSISSSFTNEHMVKLLSLINEKPTPAANMFGIEPSLSNNNSYAIVLFDVLVVPEYNDLNLGKLVGTRSVTGGLYLFDLDKI
ncbi:hypothetical protein Tco_1470151, partial [Tanacetum coccineum]